MSEWDIDGRHGLVRCGRCRSVFHAAANEVDVIHGTPSTRRGGRAPLPTTGAAPHAGDVDAPAGPTAEREPGTDWQEPVLPGTDRRQAPLPEEDRVAPVEIDEEIPIESPLGPSETVEESVEDVAIEGRPAPPAAGESEKRSKRAPPEMGRSSVLHPARRARELRIESPRSHPFKTASLALFAFCLVVLLLWQVKTFYLNELAQIPLLRPYLELACQPLDCEVPARRDFARVDLVGTEIDVNPQIPGALEIKASLINRAHFPQPYPPLRITLTDSEGRVVGQRTYLPSEYREDDGQELLPIKDVRDATIKLAQPAANAVGYEVELVPPIRQQPSLSLLSR